MKNLLVLSLFLSLVVISCEIKPEPINYNYDECSYCKMKISDSRFGAEMVTKKGKIHKYDSAECLVRTYIEQGKQDYAYTLVTDYARPNILIDATMATFLISDKQSSPMGGNLSAYEQKSQAKLVHDEKGGKLVSFLELLDEYEEIYK